MKCACTVLLAALAIGAMLATSTAAQAHCFGRCRHFGWPHNHWGYAGLIQGGWGLGGVADAPWVGGSVFAVTSYGPYPYALYPERLRP